MHLQHTLYIHFAPFSDDTKYKVHPQCPCEFTNSVHCTYTVLCSVHIRFKLHVPNTHVSGLRFYTARAQCPCDYTWFLHSTFTIPMWFHLYFKLHVNTIHLNIFIVYSVRLHRMPVQCTFTVVPWMIFYCTLHLHGVVHGAHVLCMEYLTHLWVYLYFTLHLPVWVQLAFTMHVHSISVSSFSLYNARAWCAPCTAHLQCILSTRCTCECMYIAHGTCTVY